jgi:hypothetical protein
MVARDLDEALDHLDVASLAALEVLIAMAALAGGPQTNAVLALAEVITSSRRRVYELRAYRREQLTRQQPKQAHRR